MDNYRNLDPRYEANFHWGWLGDLNGILRRDGVCTVHEIAVAHGMYGLVTLEGKSKLD